MLPEVLNSDISLVSFSIFFSSACFDGGPVGTGLDKGDVVAEDDADGLFELVGVVIPFS